MLESVFSILGLDPTAMDIPDIALLIVLALVTLWILDWVFRILYLVIDRLTKRR